MGLYSVEVTFDQGAGKSELVKSGFGDATCLGMAKDGVFYYAVSSTGTELYGASLELSSGKQLSAPKVIASRRFGNNSQAVWSQDGASLAYYSGGASMAMCVKDWEMQTERVYLLAPPVSFVRFSSYPQWSPGGNSIRFSGGASDGFNRGLFSLDLSNGEFSILHLFNGNVNTLNDLSNGRLPAQGTDNSGTVMFARGEDQQLMLVTKTLNTGAEEISIIPNPDGYMRHSFFPTVVDYKDKIAIAVWKNSEGRFLAKLHDLKAEKEFDLILSDHYLSFEIAPDRSRVAGLIWENDDAPTVRGFSLSDDSPKQIFEVDLPVGSQVLDWTPDSQYLLFLKTAQLPAGEVEELWTLARDTGELRRTELAMENLTDATVRPNGNEIILQVEESRNSVWAMENLDL